MIEARARWFLFALALAGVSEALADGLIRDGVGARSSGRGGTNIAAADNGAILLDNPAGMVNIEGRGLLDLGVDTLFTDIQYADPQNSKTCAWNNPLPIPQASLVYRTLDEQWAFGLGVFAPAGFSADYDMQGPPPFLAGEQHYKAMGAMVKLLPGVAYRVTDRLSIGATLGLGIGHTELEGPYFLQSPGLFQGTPTLMRLYTTGAALAWSAGLQYRLTEKTVLGATYQSATRYSQTGNARLDVPMLGQSDFDAEFDMAWPQSVGIGARHSLCAHRVVSADLIYFNWSRAFDEFGVRLSDPSNPAFAALLGPTVSDRFPLGWEDSISLRFGYEQFLGRGRVVRAGYAFHPNQIPERTLTPYIPAILEHAFSLGYGWQRKAWEIDLAYQYSFGQQRTVADSSLVGGDFDDSWYRSQAHWGFLSLLRRF